MPTAIETDVDDEDGEIPSALLIRGADDPATLEAWYGPGGFVDHCRKVVLANCEEIVRAKYAVKGEKISETRITTLARLHPNYLDFLAVHLNGRRLREVNVIDSTQR